MREARCASALTEGECEAGGRSGRGMGGAAAHDQRDRGLGLRPVSNDRTGEGLLWEPDRQDKCGWIEAKELGLRTAARRRPAARRHRHRRHGEAPARGPH